MTFDKTRCGSTRRSLVMTFAETRCGLTRCSPLLCLHFLQLQFIVQSSVSSTEFRLKTLEGEACRLKRDVKHNEQLSNNFKDQVFVYVTFSGLVFMSLSIILFFNRIFHLF